MIRRAIVPATCLLSRLLSAPRLGPGTHLTLKTSISKWRTRLGCAKQICFLPCIRNTLKEQLPSFQGISTNNLSVKEKLLEEEKDILRYPPTPHRKFFFMNSLGSPTLYLHGFKRAVCEYNRPREQALKTTAAVSRRHVEM